MGNKSQKSEGGKMRELGEERKSQESRKICHQQTDGFHSEKEVDGGGKKDERKNGKKQIVGHHQKRINKDMMIS